ncbi:MAG TPA: hypothetical protein VG053_09190 [Solirubrobacteraceae bacterium]|jgi:hypothetical protein|nr:hypothetical protein [Solirubrobacteraceae bacterium]
MPPKRGAAVRVVFDEDSWSEDMARTTPNGQAVAEATRRDYEGAGCPGEDLLACDGEARDGTRLPECAKVYLPSPDGKFGMVFDIDRQAGSLVLAYLAFGTRHHPKESRAPSVYEIAHRRLN